MNLEKSHCCKHCEHIGVCGISVYCEDRTLTEIENHRCQKHDVMIEMPVWVVCNDYNENMALDDYGMRVDGN